MDPYFKSLFSREPIEVIGNDYYFQSDQDGDPFDEEDVNYWFGKGILKHNWENKVNNTGEFFPSFRDAVLSAFSKQPASFLEIACGPGMGLTPLILSQYPQMKCLLTDASSLVIQSWRQYVDQYLGSYPFSMASFSMMDIPIKDNALDIVTSFIGVGSSRARDSGKMKGLQEIYRILKKGGYFIALENEWCDYDGIEEVFRRWNRPIWDTFKETKTWPERFEETGFTMVSSEPSHYRYLTKEDNEFGAQAELYGISIRLKYTLYVLKKG